MHRLRRKDQARRRHRALPRRHRSRRPHRLQRTRLKSILPHPSQNPRLRHHRRKLPFLRQRPIKSTQNGPHRRRTNSDGRKRSRHRNHRLTQSPRVTKVYRRGCKPHVDALESTNASPRHDRGRRRRNTRTASQDCQGNPTSPTSIYITKTPPVLQIHRTSLRNPRFHTNPTRPQPNNHKTRFHNRETGFSSFAKD